MPATVIFDADCDLCQQTRRAVEALDWLGTMHWLPQQDPSASAFGIPLEALGKSVYLVTAGGRSYHGFDAVKQVLLRLPISYLAGGAAVVRAPWAALPIALFFSPAFHPVGEAAYDWVAANRYLFPGSKTCEHFPVPNPMGE